MDVIGLGDILIDFTPAGLSAAGKPLYERNAGGDIANLLCQVARLGGKASFMGKVGKDPLGAYLKEVLTGRRVDTAGLIETDEAFTAHGFVYLDADGDRSFTFDLGADLLLRQDEVDFSAIGRAKIFHSSMLPMTAEPSRGTALAALERAKKAGVLVSFDENWRPTLWKSEEEAKHWMVHVLQYVDMLKISEEELELITGETDLNAGVEKLSKHGVSLIVVTLGPKGCYYRRGTDTGGVPTYNTKVVDTTGAGDAFWGAFLYRMLQYGNIAAISSEELCDMLEFANASGSFCASGRGGIDAQATQEDIEQCRRNTPKLI